MGRKRKSNKGLPERVYYKHGAYYYVPLEPLPGLPKWIRLGSTKSKMYSSLADLEVRPEGGLTLNSIWIDFVEDHLPSLSPATQRGYKRHAKMFLAAFGHMHPDEVKSSHIADYLRRRGKKAKTSANNEIRCLSSMFKYAVSLGLSEANPCRGVPTHKVPPRDRYIEHFEFAAFKSVCDEFMSCYVDLKYITGLRQTDMLKLTMDNIKEDGLYVRPSKTRNSTGEARVFLWTPELEDIIDRIKKLPRPKHATHFFCNKKGKPFIDEELNVTGFNTLWTNIMTKALKSTALTTRFQEKDIRAKTATDADGDGQDATLLLGHGDRQMTKRYIRSRKAKRVMPLITKRDTND